MYIDGSQTTTQKVSVHVDETELIGRLISQALSRSVGNSDAWVNKRGELVYTQDAEGRGSDWDVEIPNTSPEKIEEVKLIRAAERKMYDLLRADKNAR